MRTQDRISLGRPEDFGALIRRYRKQAGLTQSQLGMASGVSLATVSAIENGKPTAQVGIVLHLCADLGIPIFSEKPADGA